MPKLKDTDYLVISARVRALENKLLTRERMERMLEARSSEEAVKVLGECGYGEFSAASPSAMEEKLVEVRSAAYEDMRAGVPNPSLIDVFRLKYDYHNVKVLIKAEAVGADGARLLMEGGRYPSAALREAYHKEDLRDVSETFRQAVLQAKETLSVTGDPQAADFVLDRAYYQELRDAAEASESQFLQGYVRLMIDAANLRAAVRASRMGRGAEFLSQVLVSGGNADQARIAAADPAQLAALFSGTPLAEAAAKGSALTAAGSGPLTAFERLCDNALTAYLAQSRRIPFGEHVVLGYLFAKEAELTTIRIIMTGRMAGLDTEIIRERLRESYV